MLCLWRQMRARIYVDKSSIETIIELCAQKKELFSKIKSIENLLMLLATLLQCCIFQISA